VVDERSLPFDLIEGGIRFRVPLLEEFESVLVRWTPRAA